MMLCSLGRNLEKPRESPNRQAKIKSVMNSPPSCTCSSLEILKGKKGKAYPSECKSGRMNFPNTCSADWTIPVSRLLAPSGSSTCNCHEAHLDCRQLLSLAGHSMLSSSSPKDRTETETMNAMPLLGVTARVRKCWHCDPLLEG